MMKRRDEMLVGATILFALTVIVAGALWLSEAHLSSGGTIHTARFRTVGGLGVGNPVVLRGVRVGRVIEIRLGDGEWVEAVLQVFPDVTLQPDPAVIAASASLFGEWHVNIVSMSVTDIDDPNVRQDLELAAAAGSDAWPGATLPDIGQLTAQAGRIASDIGAFSQRIETAFDDEVVLHLQSSISDFGEVASQINTFAGQQIEIFGEVAENVRVTSEVVTGTSQTLERIMARFDSATTDGALDSIITNTQRVSTDLRAVMNDFRDFVTMVNSSGPAVERVLLGADTLMTRIVAGEGTMGRLVSDSTLYVETSLAIAELRALLTDIRENPRKYFKFSVF